MMVAVTDDLTGPVMLLPQTARYALRAVFHLAAREHLGPCSAPVLAAALGVPQNYLAKTLGRLARARVLCSVRGPDGGFRLAVPAHALTLARVVAPFIDVGERHCLIAGWPCGGHPACPIHDRWAPVADAVGAFFGSTTVSDLAAAGASVRGGGSRHPPPA